MATRLSSNTPFTDDQLTDYFPTSTTQEVVSTAEFAQRLVREGFVDDGQYEQIQQAVGTYLNTLAESYTLGTPTVEGTPGTTTRRYRIVPTYALPTVYPSSAPDASPPQGEPPSTPSSVLPFRMWANPPAQGYAVIVSPLGAQAVANNQSQGRTRCYGNMQSIITVTTTAATLTSVNYVLLTMPAASANAADVTFDVLVSDGASGAFSGIAFNVPPAGTVSDNGTLTRLPYSMYDPNDHSAGVSVRYFQTEVGIDTTTTPAVTRIYQINTFVAPWVETV